MAAGPGRGACVRPRLRRAWARMRYLEEIFLTSDYIFSTVTAWSHVVARASAAATPPCPRLVSRASATRSTREHTMKKPADKRAASTAGKRGLDPSLIVLLLVLVTTAGGFMWLVHGYV